MTVVEMDRIRTEAHGSHPVGVLGISVLLLVALSFQVSAAEPPDDAALAERSVRLLATRCVSCHGPDQAEGQLRLDSRAALVQGGEHGASLNTEKPSESLLLRVVRHAVPGVEMPPKDKLSGDDIVLLERWIVQGAPWPRTKAAASTPDAVGDAWHDPRNPIVQLFGGKRLDLWSLKPLKSRGVSPQSLPSEHRETGATRRGAVIDDFILAKLDAAGLTPSPQADRRTLIRRLSFDLIGLPPSPEDVTTFVADNAPDAYEQLVERLLASPHYGEHWARLWLDVVRYSDSNGFDWDEFRPAAWRFRDYVVRSLNADKPFTRFVEEQLAGDELLAGAPTTEAEQDALIATGYLRLGPHDNAAGLFNEQDRARAEWLADLTETTGSAFLGLTLSCCRCHDHKFDPLSQADHYRLRAFFATIQHGDMPLDIAADQEQVRAHNAAIEEDINRLEAKDAAVLDPIRTRLRDERRTQLADDERELLDRGDDGLSDAESKRRKKLQKQIEPPDKDVVAALSPEEKAVHEALQKEIADAKGRKRSFTKGLLATDGAGDAAVTHVLYQGNHKAPRDAVAPGFLSALDPQPAAIAPAPNPNTRGRRLTLARWIASADNPLTARVLVNRVWQAHFGQGLVATPNDFGLAGAPPTHPELLDWLAADFIEHGWSLKSLHRRIVLSATYRQMSYRAPMRGFDPKTIDGGNQLYWRQNPRRLSAEQLRDALLAVSGTLLPTLGGPPIWPDLPPEVLQANPAFLDDNETKTKGWYPSPAAMQPVRSLYVIQKRTVRVPFLETFDLPENSVSCARRSTSTVAPQALSLLNNPLAVDAAEALAGRVANEVVHDANEQITRVFALSLQRSPTEDERRACREFLEKRSLPELCRALMNLNEFVWID